MGPSDRDAHVLKESEAMGDVFQQFISNIFMLTGKRSIARPRVPLRAMRSSTTKRRSGATRRRCLWRSAWALWLSQRSL